MAPPKHFREGTLLSGTDRLATGRASRVRGRPGIGPPAGTDRSAGRGSPLGAARSVVLAGRFARRVEAIPVHAAGGNADLQRISLRRLSDLSHAGLSRFRG